MTEEKILEIRNLRKKYGSREVIRDLSFDVRKGEVVGLLGPNGAGKTTAFYMTIGLIAPDTGQVHFNGENITDWPIHKRAQKGMGYLAQEPSIFPTLTVEQNILCILETLPFSRKMRKEKLEELLAELHLEKLAKKIACSLSGGERRRLEITRSLATNPSLLLLDEPFANIDPIAVQDVKALINLLTQKNISVLITDHNAREIFSIVTRSYLIQEGSVLRSGSVDELLNDQVARSTYFGEEFRL